MAEIKKLAKADPVTAADGAVILMEKIWPALEQVDSSSGALGGSVGWTLTELLPIVVEAPADRKTRDEWLDRLYQAILEDGVDYLCLVQERWGDLCGSSEVASHWADEFLPQLKADLTDPGLLIVASQHSESRPEYPARIVDFLLARRAKERICFPSSNRSQLYLPDMLRFPSRPESAPENALQGKAIP